jgi:hypothetical protein
MRPASGIVRKKLGSARRLAAIQSQLSAPTRLESELLEADVSRVSYPSVRRGMAPPCVGYAAGKKGSYVVMGFIREIRDSALPWHHKYIGHPDVVGNAVIKAATRLSHTEIPITRRPGRKVPPTHLRIFKNGWRFPSKYTTESGQDPNHPNLIPLVGLTRCVRMLTFPEVSKRNR